MCSHAKFFFKSWMKKKRNLSDRGKDQREFLRILNIFILSSFFSVYMALNYTHIEVMRHKSMARMNGEKERLSGSEWVLSFFHPVLMTIKKFLLLTILARHCIYAIKKRARRHQLNKFFMSWIIHKSDRSWMINL